MDKRKEWKTNSRHSTYEAANAAREALVAAGKEAKVRRRANNSYDVRVVARVVETAVETDAVETVT
tara:strand:- start:286 stop:483 length:198 start_codon:yes stop_codon:yes gene_type:complete